MVGTAASPPLPTLLLALPLSPCGRGWRAPSIARWEPGEGCLHSKKSKATPPPTPHSVRRTLSHKGERGNVSTAQANRYAPSCRVRGGRSVGHLRGGTRSGDGRAEDQNFSRDRHAGRRVSALRRRSRRGRPPDGRLALPPAAPPQDHPPQPSPPPSVL